MRIPGWMFMVGLFAFVGVTVACAILAYAVGQRFGADFGDVGEDNAFIALQTTLTPTQSPATVQPTPTNTPRPGETITPEPTSNIPTATPDPLDAITEINDPSRITILLMGIDQRSAFPDAENAYFTDTMILVQIDPVLNHIGVLSIPRDLFVEIPGFQSGRITTANFLGDINALPQGGAGVAIETVYRNFGVQVDHYVRINFDVFINVVEAIAPDGIEICVDEYIYDGDYPDAGYGTIEVEFQIGCEFMGAERLLQYARTRATAGSDFDRNRRQQEVLSAVQSHLLSVGGIRNFLTQIPSLYNSLRDNFVTDLNIDDILSLGLLVSRISTDDITFEQIDTRYVEFANFNGQDVLLPFQSGLAQAVQDAFNPPPDNLPLADLRQRYEAETATVVVFNNTDIPGLAGDTRLWLNSLDVDILDVGNIEPSLNENTTIRVYSGGVWTARYLAALLGLPEDRIVTVNDDLTTADIMIAAGPDMPALIAGQ